MVDIVEQDADDGKEHDDQQGRDDGQGSAETAGMRVLTDGGCCVAFVRVRGQLFGIGKLLLKMLQLRAQLVALRAGGIGAEIVITVLAAERVHDGADGFVLGICIRIGENAGEGSLRDTGPCGQRGVGEIVGLAIGKQPWLQLTPGQERKVSTATKLAKLLALDALIIHTDSFFAYEMQNDMICAAVLSIAECAYRFCRLKILSRDGSI